MGTLLAGTGLKAVNVFLLALQNLITSIGRYKVAHIISHLGNEELRRWGVSSQGKESEAGESCRGTLWVSLRRRQSSHLCPILKQTYLPTRARLVPPASVSCTLDSRQSRPCLCIPWWVHTLISSHLPGFPSALRSIHWLGQ